MAKYIISIDQSTQGTKALLFDETGSIMRRTDRPHKQIINEKGWVSHDPEEIYSNVLAVVKELLEGVEKEYVNCLRVLKKNVWLVLASATSVKLPLHGTVLQVSLMEMQLYGSVPVPWIFVPVWKRLAQQS